MLSNNYAIFWGRGGGGSLKDHNGSQGGGQDWPKKDRIIFELSLFSGLNLQALVSHYLRGRYPLAGAGCLKCTGTDLGVGWIKCKIRLSSASAGSSGC